MSASAGTFTRWHAAWHRRMDSWPGFDYLMIRSVVFLLSGIGVVLVM